MKKQSLITTGLSLALAAGVSFGALNANRAQAQDTATLSCSSTLYALVATAAAGYGYEPAYDLNAFDLGDWRPVFESYGWVDSMDDSAAMATEEATEEAMVMATEDPAMLNASCETLDQDVQSFMMGMFGMGPSTSDVANSFDVLLSGPQEVPGPGDDDGQGTANVTIDTETSEICWTISVGGIQTPAAAAHIHNAPIGEAGSVVVELTAPDVEGASTGCTTVEEAVAADIAANPANYYVNVHTGEFPDGAVRGQLLGN